MSELIIDSKELCFFCMDKTSPPQINGGVDVSRPESNTVHSLQYLSRFLRMDMRKVFVEKGDIPSHLIAKVETSTLKARLCTKCASLNESFSKLCRRLEKIEMEVVSSLEHIYSELIKTESTNEYQQLMTITEDVEDEWRAKIGILEVVRKEAIQKCSITIQKNRPRVNVAKLTNSDVTKIKHKYKLNSRRMQKSDIDYNSGIKIELDENLTDPSIDDQEVDYQSDFGMEGGGPSSPTICEESKVLKIEHEKSTPGTNYSHSQGVLLDSRISENIESVKLTGNPSAQKFRCRLCQKVFTESNNTVRHIRTVHLKEQRFQCPQCFKMFSSRQNMEGHVRIHTGLKPFKCDLCLKTFHHKQHKDQHMLVHSVTKPSHKCEICGRIFSHRRSLTHHTKHTHLKHRRATKNVY